MGIKWKSTNPHPVRAWLSFFLGWTSILVFLVIGAYLQFPASEAGQDASHPFGGGLSQFRGLYSADEPGFPGDFTAYLRL